LTLGTALSVAWSSSRRRAWRLIRLGLALGLPFLPVFVFEMMLLGNSWFATGVVGTLYVMATAHLYLTMPIADAPVASVSARKSGGLDHQNQDDPNLPQAGSGWSRPFE
jgi:hypothetical protein